MGPAGGIFFLFFFVALFFSFVSTFNKILTVAICIYLFSLFLYLFDFVSTYKNIFIVAIFFSSFFVLFSALFIFFCFLLYFLILSGKTNYKLSVSASSIQI